MYVNLCILDMSVFWMPTNVSYFKLNKGLETIVRSFFNHVNKLKLRYPQVKRFSLANLKSCLRFPNCWRRQRSQYRLFIDIAPSVGSIYSVDISLQIIIRSNFICEMLFFIQWLNSITPYWVLFLEASIICSENLFLFEEALGGQLDDKYCY